MNVSLENNPMCFICYEGNTKEFSKKPFCPSEGLKVNLDIIDNNRVSLNISARTPHDPVHIECLQQALMRDARCPMCRLPLISTEYSPTADQVFQELTLSGFDEIPYHALTDLLNLTRTDQYSEILHDLFYFMVDRNTNPFPEELTRSNVERFKELMNQATD